jgi:hypothetical protein
MLPFGAPLSDIMGVTSRFCEKIGDRAGSSGNGPEDAEMTKDSWKDEKGDISQVLSLSVI